MQFIVVGIIDIKDENYKLKIEEEIRNWFELIPNRFEKNSKQV